MVYNSDIPKKLDMKGGGNMSTIIANTEAIIKDRGFKKKYVAEKAGYSKQQFSNLLNGRKVFKVDDVLRIANALEVTPNELFGFRS